ncbi:protein SRG1-like [Abrus precatorius]|uniref:Protein SRG1-like n=1 Tax=Abrus precatorius TaxID=3816 RepID=A0A8B8K404_ABRPR|nr:protein SRG1-like [Abrus precatorius]
MEEAPSYATCVSVPNVQEMVRKNPLQVPKRYVRSEGEVERGNYMSHLSSEIPVIDFTLLSSGNKEEFLKLDMAVKKWGFFQIVNHGLPKELMQKIKNVTDEFFKLPIEEKEKWKMPPDDIQDYGHTFVVSEEQVLDWCNQLILLVYPTKFRKLQFWPETHRDSSWDIIEAYSSEIKRIGEQLVCSLSVIMGLEKHDLLGLHKELLQGLRVNYYPPCNTPEQVIGLTSHSDPCTISLVMQDDDITALEIRYKGSWVPVNPIPDALVVNVGDVIEIWSNGKYKSVEHRAMTNKNKRKTSHVTFLFPRDDAEVGPFDHMIDADNPKQYQKVNYGEYLRFSLNRELEGKTQTETAKITE